VKKSGIPQLHALTEGPNIALDKPIILIGRHQECDIQIPSRKISRRHCCLAQVGDRLVVRDLGSTNGVRINGIKVLEGNLQAGDELMLGNIRYQLKWGDEVSDSAIASMKHGIVAQKAVPSRKASSDESCELPVALPDASQSQPIAQAKPIGPALHNQGPSPKAKSNGEVAPKSGSLIMPDNLGLVPFDPP